MELERLVYPEGVKKYYLGDWVIDSVISQDNEYKILYNKIKLMLKISVIKGSVSLRLKYMPWDQWTNKIKLDTYIQTISCSQNLLGNIYCIEYDKINRSINIYIKNKFISDHYELDDFNIDVIGINEIDRISIRTQDNFIAYNNLIISNAIDYNRDLYEFIVPNPEDNFQFILRPKYSKLNCNYFLNILTRISNKSNIITPKGDRKLGKTRQMIIDYYTSNESVKSLSEKYNISSTRFREITNKIRDIKVIRNIDFVRVRKLSKYEKEEIDMYKIDLQNNNIESDPYISKYRVYNHLVNKTDYGKQVLELAKLEGLL